MNSHSFLPYPDAGTSSYLIKGPSAKYTNTNMAHRTPLREHQPIPEFSEKLKRTMIPLDEPSELTVNSPPRRFSYVSNWRQNITPLRIDSPPSSPFGVSEFPTSPVAVVSPERLRVTSVPPYDPRTASKLAGVAASEYTQPSIVNEPTHFHDLYDVELEQMIDELPTSSDSSSTVSATIYIPPVEPSRMASRSHRRRKTITSLIRWFPTRVKYTLLSNMAKIVHHP
ncbi:hypothetical protein FB446DRAFT_738732 [Lentinula raphanica]|nr:hypothetical protein FB446DRAFT_738732 [Lentinula raphanica]